jgi:hypothetical protein
MPVGRVEHALGGRGPGVFPSWWGTPEGQPYSETRAAWCQKQIATDLALERRGLDPEEIRTGRKNYDPKAALRRVERMQRRDAEAIPAPTPSFGWPGSEPKKYSIDELVAALERLSGGPLPRSMSAREALARARALRGETL